MSANNPVLFACAYCRSDIERDSFFCDQCGKELFLCENCQLPGRDQWCEEDGGALVAARTVAGNAAPVATAAPAMVAAGATTRFDAPAQTPAATATLRLVNANLGLTLDIQHDAILGRAAGPYMAQLGTLPAISGKHLLFRYDALKGWTFTDTGSSNGTKYSKSNKTWQQEPKVLPNVPIPLDHNTFLLVANVEFAVHIESPASHSTQRI
jgi:hypothetical protein